MPTPRTYIAAAIAAAFISAPAFAGSIETAQSVDVKIAGYDLSSEPGATIVLNKIEDAAKRVCNVRTSSDSLRFRQLAKACVATAVSNAVASIDTPALTRVHTAYETRKAG